MENEINTTKRIFIFNLRVNKCVLYYSGVFFSILKVYRLLPEIFRGKKRCFASRIELSGSIVTGKIPGTLEQSS